METPRGTRLFLIRRAAPSRGGGSATHTQPREALSPGGPGGTAHRARVSLPLVPDGGFGWSRSARTDGTRIQSAQSCAANLGGTEWKQRRGEGKGLKQQFKFFSVVSCFIL